MHSSLKTTWYKSSVVHCFCFLAHSILFFRCLSVSVIRILAISCLRYILKFYPLTSYWTFLQCLIKTNAYFFRQIRCIHLLVSKFNFAGLPLRFWSLYFPVFLNFRKIFHIPWIVTSTPCLTSIIFIIFRRDIPFSFNVTIIILCLNEILVQLRPKVSSHLNKL